MRILGIETSCDDTGVAVYDAAKGLLAHLIYSQTTTHAPYGGVVPELASRDHSRKLLVLIDKIFKDAAIPPESIQGIAYTAGPGLVGALLVGATFAKTLSYTWNIPSIGVHHMEGHLLAPMLETNPPEFPFLALLVSGGHTMLIDVQAFGKYRILGESLDDAAGEAFDKTAKLLGLPYPGGPELAKLAEQGIPNRFTFPRPLADKPGFDFSFSGLKTFTMNLFKSTSQTLQDKADIAWGFQDAVVETLYLKSKRALLETGHNRLVIAGGVGANLKLRDKFKDFTKLYQTQIYFPRSEFCTDNGAMIAYAGYQRLKMGHPESLEIVVHPRWSMDTLNI